MRAMVLLNTQLDDPSRASGFYVTLNLLSGFSNLTAPDSCVFAWPPRDVVDPHCLLAGIYTSSAII